MRAPGHARRALVVGAATLVAVACLAEFPTAPELADARGRLPEIVADTVLPSWPTVALGQPVPFCWFGGFASGHVAMRTRDAARCGTMYRAAFDTLARAVSRKEQAVADTATIAWSVTLDLQS